MTTFDEGKYLCRVTRQALGETKNGNPQFVLSFDPMGMVDSRNPEGDLIACPNYERSVFRSITKKTVDWVLDEVKHLCELAGIKESLSGFEYLDPNTSGFFDFTGVEFEATCSHETWEGKTREKWSIWTGGSMEVTPLDNSKARKLNSLYGKELKSKFPNGARKSEKKPAQQEAAPAGPPDDDIPF